MKRKLVDLFCYLFLAAMTIYLMDMFVTELVR